MTGYIIAITILSVVVFALCINAYIQHRDIMILTGIVDLFYRLFIKEDVDHDE